jgi:hypothetical protein
MIFLETASHFPGSCAENRPRKPLFALRYGGICGKLHMKCKLCNDGI